MPSTVLLSPTNSPLRTLTLSRFQLDQDAPVCTVETQGEELCLAVLIGAVEIVDASTGQHYGQGVLGGRRQVTERGLTVFRLPAGRPQAFDVHLCDFSADILLTSTRGLPGTAACPAHPDGVCIHHDDIWAHQVGEGTHQREVREVRTPPGYAISCGETLQQAGMISSWPPHANTDDLAKFQAGVTTWEEAFWIVAPAPGIAVLDGYYADRTPVHEVIRLENGHAYCMPLGSHMAYAAPDSYLYYAWFYCGNALQKQYRKYSDDVGVYRK